MKTTRIQNLVTLALACMVLFMTTNAQAADMAAEDPSRSNAAALAVVMQKANAQAAAARGLWGNLEFLEKVAELNPVPRSSRPSLRAPPSRR
jgi:hypothetical protein